MFGLADLDEAGLSNRRSGGDSIASAGGLGFVTEPNAAYACDKGAMRTRAMPNKAARGCYLGGEPRISLE